MRRTPLTRAKKGGFRDTSADGLLYKTLKSGMAQSGLKPEQVQDIIAGESGAGCAPAKTGTVAVADPRI